MDSTQTNIKCSDLLIHVFGYGKSNGAKWFIANKNNIDYVYIIDGVRYFTIKGLNYAI